MRTRIGNRKRPVAQPPLDGGGLRGVVISDVASRQRSLPFTNVGDVLRGDGTMGPAGAGAVSWGVIGGTLSNQTDLQSALDAKQDLLVWDEEFGAYLVAR